jgi:hypothetical protein
VVTDICLPVELSSARLCPACAERAAIVARDAFDAKLRTVIELVEAGANATALPLVEELITHAYAHFLLDIAARLEDTLPMLRAGRPSADA